MSDEHELDAVEAPDDDTPVFRNIVLAALTGAAGLGLLGVCTVFVGRARQDAAFDQQGRASDLEVRLQRNRAAIRAAGGDPDSPVLTSGDPKVAGELVALIAAKFLG